MCRICVFAGTTEGRELVEFLGEQPAEVTACVATEYGGTLLPSGGGVEVLRGRLPPEKLRTLLESRRFDLVVDATHPYAASITEHLAGACEASGTEYLRLLRGASALPKDSVCVPDMEAAAAFLAGTEGRILLTTGSKELKKFRDLPEFAQRVYARVLPMEESLAACREAGLPPAHILAMQGPFPEELDLALLHFLSAAWLVTKDGGGPGGFAAKAAAARQAGARLLVVGRPPQREGLTLGETVALLCRRFGFRPRPRVALLGIGPGSRETMTWEVRRAAAEAGCLIGAGRMLEAVAAPGQPVFEAVAAGDIAALIRAHPEYRRFAVVLSGDTGFFSGAKKLLPLLEDCQVEVLPGISSLAMLCARLGTSYEDVTVVSAHGRRRNIAADVRAHRRVFALVGGEDGVSALCRELVEAGLDGVGVTVGQRLSYPDERIVRGTAGELAGGSFGSLSAVLIENSHPDAVVTPGLPDDAFLRGGGERGVVPMTKSEVRAVCLSKLRLTAESVCWDVGAGTGSVAIEMARLARQGQVYAVECREDALELLEQNRKKFSAENLTVVSGTAPEACRSLPVPSHVFVGGSSGKLREILELLLEKNPCVRIVATAVTLETAAQLTACMTELPFAETEAVSLQAARSRRAGASHLMLGQNPVWIFTFQGGRKKEEGRPCAP